MKRSIVRVKGSNQRPPSQRRPNRGARAESDGRDGRSIQRSMLLRYDLDFVIQSGWEKAYGGTPCGNLGPATALRREVRAPAGPHGREAKVRVCWDVVAEALRKVDVIDMLMG